MSPMIKNLIKKGFKIETPSTQPQPRVPRGFCIPVENVGKAVDEYLRIKVRRRGDGTRIARKYGISLSSMLTQAKRRADKGAVKYPQIYAKRADRS